MLDLLERLNAALAGRYVVVREIGRGATATVFLAQDLKHHRHVAVKVLRPEVATALGGERFLREIEIAANLTHPNILPIHDSGDAGGAAYYVTPYLEGESLRDRLGREGPLELTLALRITHEVGDALGYAHARGLIHRDIKPGNILLAGDHPLVADFGIARAIEEAVWEPLTETGIAIGTPGYMSPEQATGERHLDGRSDLYSLGCVLYEMLAGKRPFDGPSPGGILAQQLNSPPPVLPAQPDVPDRVSRAIRRAMATRRDDRFASISDFLAALERGHEVPTVRVRPMSFRRGRRPALLLGAALAAGAALIGGLRWFRAAAPIDASVVAVMPFRVAAATSELDYLREGIVDLFDAKLGDYGTPRAVDPRAVLHAWRRAGGGPAKELDAAAALRVARALGAGQLLLGGVVGTPGRVAISATLLAVPDGRRSAAASVEGPPDSLSVMIDHLAAKLLALRGREGEQRLATLTSYSLPALQAYLAGQAMYRRGEYAVAARHFDRALELDSTFALAGLGLTASAGWLADWPATHRGRRLAWTARARLGRRDQALLAAYAGPNYPVGPTYADQIASWELATQAAPDRAEAWFELGDFLFHQGPYLGLAGAHRRAGAAFERALAVDSTYAPAIEHLIELAVLGRNARQLRQLAELYVTQAPESELVGYIRWRVAVALGDSAAVRNVRGEFDRMGSRSLQRIVGVAQLDGVDLADAELAATILEKRGGNRGERDAVLELFGRLRRNQGRPQAARALDESPGASRPLVETQARRIMDALYYGGDAESAARAARQLETMQTRDPRLEHLGTCWREQWRLAHGDTTSTTASVARLRAIADSAPLEGWHPAPKGQPDLCATILETTLAGARTGEVGATPPVEAIDYLDSLMRTGPIGDGERLPNLLIGRWKAARGDARGALQAIRRRPYSWRTSDLHFLGGYLLMEGRLASAVGEWEAAARAYRHYLALRAAPEAALVAEARQVRAQLDKLTEHRRVAAGGPYAATRRKSHMRAASTSASWASAHASPAVSP